MFIGISDYSWEPEGPGNGKSKKPYFRVRWYFGT
jgi:hypothetical protein